MQSGQKQWKPVQTKMAKSGFLRSSLAMYNRPRFDDKTGIGPFDVMTAVSVKAVSLLTEFGST